MWTSYFDMHSGGGSKEKYELIYIEAPQEEADIIFYNRFGHNPHRVSCTCCGNDYSVSSLESLEEESEYRKSCNHDTLIISKEDIKDDEHEGDLPEEGYVWM